MQKDLKDFIVDDDSESHKKSRIKIIRSIKLLLPYLPIFLNILPHKSISI